MRAAVRDFSLRGAILLAAVAFGGLAHADDDDADTTPPPAAHPARPEAVPPGVVIPARLTLEEALRLFHTRGLDLLIADTTVQSAEGDLRIAKAVTNPSVSLGAGYSFGYDPSTANASCSPSCNGSASPFTWSINVSDQAAIAQTVFGKRGLQIKVAKWAYEAAKMDRADTQRTLEGGLKQQYAQVALAKVSVEYAKEGHAFAAQTFDLVTKKFNAGAVSDADVASAETDALEQEQAIAVAQNNLRQQKVTLAFLLGSRKLAPDFDVDDDFLKKKVTEGVVAPEARDTLVKDAYEIRPDLKSIEDNRKRAETSIRLAERQRIPDISLWANYTMEGTGNSAISPPTLTVGVSGPIPIFYQQQGEIMKARADLRLQDATRAKRESQVANDIEGGRASLQYAKERVDRLEGRLLKRAGDMRDLVKIQYDKGSATLIDLIIAERQFVATKQEYLQAQTDYWTAVFALEQAVGRELHR
jgi:outer membrane protein, heavy metal efflux system